MKLDTYSHASQVAVQAGRHYRERDLLPRTEITVAQAAENRRNGKRGRRPRLGSQGIVPVSSGTLWTWVKTGQFPRPVKLSDNITAWRGEDILAWLAERGSK